MNFILRALLQKLPWLFNPTSTPYIFYTVTLLQIHFIIVFSIIGHYPIVIFSLIISVLCIGAAAQRTFAAAVLCLAAHALFLFYILTILFSGAITQQYATTSVEKGIIIYVTLCNAFIISFTVIAVAVWAHQFKSIREMELYAPAESKIDINEDIIIPNSLEKSNEQNEVFVASSLSSPQNWRLNAIVEETTCSACSTKHHQRNGLFTLRQSNEVIGPSSKVSDGEEGTTKSITSETIQVIISTSRTTISNHVEDYHFIDVQELSNHNRLNKTEQNIALADNFLNRNNYCTQSITDDDIETEIQKLHFTSNAIQDQLDKLQFKGDITMSTRPATGALSSLSSISNNCVSNLINPAFPETFKGCSSKKELECIGQKNVVHVCSESLV